MRYFILRDTAFLWISFEVKLFSFCFEYLGFCCIIQRKPYKRTHFSILHAHTRKEKRLTCVHRKTFLYYTAIILKTKFISLHERGDNTVLNIFYCIVYQFNQVSHLYRYIMLKRLKQTLTSQT